MMLTVFGYSILMSHGWGYNSGWALSLLACTRLGAPIPALIRKGAHDRNITIIMISSASSSPMYSRNVPSVLDILEMTCSGFRWLLNWKVHLWAEKTSLRCNRVNLHQQVWCYLWTQLLAGLHFHIWRQSINRLDYLVHRQADEGTWMDLLNMGSYWEASVWWRMKRSSEQGEKGFSQDGSCFWGTARVKMRKLPGRLICRNRLQRGTK